MTTETKLEFATAEWMAELSRAAQECLDEAGPGREAVNFSLSELYTDVPDSLSSDGTTGWHLRISAGELQFESTPANDTIVQIEAAYETVIELARFVVGGDAERQATFDARFGQAVEQGKVTLSGDLEAMPEAMAGLHDKIAARTA